MRSDRYIGIAVMEVSEEPGMVLTAPNLGSCLGVCAYDRKAKRGALIHCLLPLSKSDPAKAQVNPAMYVDTGVTALLNEMVKRGSQLKDLEINVAGGAAINDQNNFFEIGKKNHTVLRKLLWKNNLLVRGEDVGGSCSRTVSLFIDNGEVWVESNGESVKLSR